MTGVEPWNRMGWEMYRSKSAGVVLLCSRRMAEVGRRGGQGTPEALPPPPPACEQRLSQRGRAGGSLGCPRRRPAGWQAAACWLLPVAALDGFPDGHRQLLLQHRLTAAGEGGEGPDEVRLAASKVASVANQLSSLGSN